MKMHSLALDSNGRLQIKFKFTHSSPTSGGYKHHTTCHKAPPMQIEEQYFRIKGS